MEPTIIPIQTAATLTVVLLIVTAGLLAAVAVSELAARLRRAVHAATEDAR